MSTAHEANHGVVHVTVRASTSSRSMGGIPSSRRAMMKQGHQDKTNRGFCRRFAIPTEAIDRRPRMKWHLQRLQRSATPAVRQCSAATNWRKAWEATWKDRVSAPDGPWSQPASLKTAAAETDAAQTRKAA